MMIDRQDQKVAQPGHAPVWISVVSGLTGEAPVDREQAKRRLVVLLIFVAMIIGAIVVTLLAQS